MNDLSGFHIVPDVDTENALKELLKVFEGGLRSLLQPNFYLSSLDPGSGKTQAISSFLKAWKSKGFLPEGSVLVGVKTKEEIRALVNRLGLDDADFACFTSDEGINALGLGDGRRGEARILLTTQQMILSRTRDRTFSAARDFHYEGRPRSLRIWDESLVLAEPVMLSWSSLAALVEPLKPRSRGFALRIERFLGTLSDKLGHVIAVPRYFEDLAKEALKDRRGLSDAHVKTLEGIQLVAGRSMWLVAESGKGERALVGASKPLPADFAPAIITDASGRVRGTYDIWEDAGGLVRLPAKANDYRNLRVHLWATKVGKDILRHSGASRDIYDEVAKAMAAKPDERWLVISYKASDDLNVHKDLRDTVDEAVSFEYLSWGLHHGTNAYKDIKNIVIIGSGFYPAVAYTALALAASGKPVGEAGLEALPALKGAEFQHNFLQAIMRGNARNSRDGIAGECDVYMVVSKAPAPAALIREAFPGCVIDPWGPPEEDMSDHGKALVEFLKSCFASSAGKSVSKKAAREAAGIPTKQRLTTVLREAPVQQALVKMDVVVTTNKFVGPDER
ncbi:hypothetical protein [Sphingomonas sp. NIBR02145]|uniref:hypothetical protein n=1 Tax=Sphingomonas sp. NIBR02145 TaxID=3014784 RepID=UPI0022B317C2|nr:hypothetical protein [Sphingomonas sp. NIBR02145]WHU02739.1 hypothetical protein O3305_21595 [Sphingomonas sp. NIBR02145]